MTSSWKILRMNVSKKLLYKCKKFLQAVLKPDIILSHTKDTTMGQAKLRGDKATRTANALIAKEWH
jgi:hypothetical protein